MPLPVPRGRAREWRGAAAEPSPEPRSSSSHHSVDQILRIRPLQRALARVERRNARHAEPDRPAVSGRGTKVLGSTAVLTRSGLGALTVATLCRVARTCVSQSSPVPEGIHQERKRCGRLAPARIVEVVAGKGRTPILQHSDQPAVGDHRRCLVVEDAGETEPRRCRAQHHGDIVDANVQFPMRRLQFPFVETAGGRPDAHGDHVLGDRLAEPHAGVETFRDNVGETLSSS